MPDNFTHQGDSAAIQWVHISIGLDFNIIILHKCTIKQVERQKTSQQETSVSFS
jgi:hypothetical protein